MRTNTSFYRAGLKALVGMVALIAAGGAHAEFLRVTAVNANDNSIYDVTSFSPAPGATTPLNSDGAAHGSFRALVQVPNIVAGTVDVLAADTRKGQIIRYTPAVGATKASVQTVWSYATSGVGPAHPDGLSIDAAGNLYIVTSKLDDDSTSQVWVLPALSTSATGYAASPLLIDATFSGANGVKRLRETALATTSTVAWSPGDLLVLVGNDSDSGSREDSNAAEVLVYRAASISQVLAGAGPRTAPDAILISPSQFPAGEYPFGMDFWPADATVNHATLLIATTAGRVLRYDFAVSGTTYTPSLVQVFASGLGSGLQKIKTGLQLVTPYAYVSQTLSSTRGQILELGAPTTSGGTNLAGTVTQGVGAVDGLAVTRNDAVAVSTCVTKTGCDLSGGVIPHQISATASSTPSGNAIEATCVVVSDPRVHGGVCDGTTLNVATLCPGFGNEIIPGTMCGASGPTGAGFALVRTNAPGVDGIPGLLVYSQENPDQILPPAPGLTNPECIKGTSVANAVVAWAPRSDAVPSEGNIVEVDPVTGLTELTELTGFCDSSGTGTRGMSVFGVGFTLNTAAIAGGMPAYAQTKYNNLFATVDGANTVPTVKQSLESGLTIINAYLAQADYACAANQTVTVDGLVGGDANPSADYPGDTNNPNPWGEIRGRLANLYFTLNTRVLGNKVNAEWPLVAPDAPPVCPAATVNVSATPLNIASNGTATLTWSSQHAYACTASGGWSGSQGPSGTFTTGALTATTTYTLSCSGLGGSSSTASATVTVVPPPQINSFVASPSSIAGGGASTFSWSATGSSCAISGAGATYSSLPISGTYTVSGINATTAFALACANSVGQSTTATTTVTVVPPPTIKSFSAAPTSIAAGGSSTLSWSATGASCAVSGGGQTYANQPVNGSLVIPSIGATTTFALACSNSVNQTTSSTATVTVVPAPKITSFAATPSAIAVGGSSTLSWVASGSSCSVAGGGQTYANQPVSGSLTVNGIGATTAFTLSCVNTVNQSTAASATVTVVPAPSIQSFLASPASIATGGSSVLSWAATGSSCSLAGGGLAVAGLPVSGSYSTGPIASSTTYTLSCRNSVAQSVSASTNVYVSDDDD